MCVTSLLCGPWADFWPFYGLYCKRVSFSNKGLPRLGTPAKRPDGSTEVKENGRKFAPTAPVASKLRLVLLSIRDLALSSLCTQSESKVANRCNLSHLPSAEPWLELRVTVKR